MIRRLLATLGRLDAAGVPRAAGWLRAALVAVTDRAARLRGAVRGKLHDTVRGQLRDAVVGEWRDIVRGGWRELPVSLRRLDDRRTTSGVLGLLRDVPQVGAVVLAALVAASALAVAARHDGDRAGGTDGTSATGRPGDPVDGRQGLLGIPPGTRVADYLDATNRRLKGAADQDPQRVRVALASFTAFSTPAKTASLTTGVEVLRAFYLPRGGTGPAETAAVPVTGSVLADLTAAFGRAARTLDQSALALERFASTIDPVNAEQREQKAESENDARLFRTRARQLRSACGCVYAVLVKAQIGILGRLAGRPGVRAVDLAPTDVPLAALRLLPLRPDVSSVATGAP